MRQVLAAYIFFTRLPFWRIAGVPGKYFERVVPYWPLTGWLTASITAGVLYIAAMFLPVNVAVILAIITRLGITGCLHEDGLADFLDGFGGGKSREHILSIMKDSHIGTYGVVGLILYFGLLYTILTHFPVQTAICLILAGDPWSKGVSAMIINRLPYARKVEESKNKSIYTRMTGSEYIICFLFAVLPLYVLPDYKYALACLAPLVVWLLLTSLMKKKIEGYTGDCCGALFLLCELSFYLASLLIYNL